MEQGNGVLLGMPATELVRELQDSNMLEFAQSTGVLPPQTAAGSEAAQQQPQQQQPQQQQPQPMDISGAGDPQHSQQQLPLPSMVAVNTAADAAVEDAERALAQARGTVAVLNGFDQQASSRSTSYGHGTPTGDEAAGGSAGGSIGIVRRAARRGTRGADQSYASVGYGGGYGSGGGGGAYSGGSGGFGNQIGPLGFAPSERTGGKQGKGLRHFSMKVCEKVESKGTTTYNEVADELVAEMKDSQQEDGVVYDEKNIRRRVYDAINVLMALDVIAKEKKAIIWRGFAAGAPGLTGPAPALGSGPARPTVGAGAISRAQDARAAAAAAVEKKAAFLADLLEQQRALKALMARNAAAPASAASGTQLDLPFILVQAKPDATVEVQISDDMRDVQFDFSNAPFQIHDDSYVLRMMAEASKQHALAGEAVAAATAAAAAAAAATAAAGPSYPLRQPELTAPTVSHSQGTPFPFASGGRA